MIQNSKIPLIVFIIVLSACAGAVDLFCNKVDPKQPSTLRCTCRNTGGDGVLWYKNDKHMSDCYLQTEFCLGHPGCLLSVNSFTKEYTFSVDSYNYSKCDVYTCRDLYLPKVNDTKRIAAQDSTSISALNISEPTTNHTSGFIGVTTECIYGASSEEKYLDIQWLFVMESVEKSFNPRKTTIKALKGRCQLCEGHEATQFLIGFYHREEMGCQEKEAKFRIILRHKGISSELLNITTRNVYCISVADGSTSSNNLYVLYVLMVVILLFCVFFGLRIKLMIRHCKSNTNFPGKKKTFFDLGSINQLKCLPVLGIIKRIIPCLYEGGMSKKAASDKMDYKENLKSHKYKTWIRAAKGLEFLREGLQNFIGNKVASHRDQTVQKAIGLGSQNSCDLCTLCNLLPEHAVENNPCTRDTCIQQNCKNCLGSDPDGRRPCPNGICGKLYDKIVEAHRFRDPFWKNTDPSTWCSDPAGWSYAKCFQTTLNPGTCSSETDATGLLDIILNDKFFQSEVDCILTLNPNEFTSARNIINILLHSERMELKEAHLQSYIVIFIAVLHDQKCLLNDQGAAQSVEKLQKLKIDKIAISLMEEIKLMNVRKDELEQLAKREKKITKNIEENQQTVLKVLKERIEATSTVPNKKEIVKDIKEAKANLQGIKLGKGQARTDLQGKEQETFAEMEEEIPDPLERVYVNDLQRMLLRTNSAIEQRIAKVQKNQKRSSSAPGDFCYNSGSSSFSSYKSKNHTTALGVASHNTDGGEDDGTTEYHTFLPEDRRYQPLNRVFV